MSALNFIKLTSVVINSGKINKIEVFPNKYCIHLSNQVVDGFFLFTSGYIRTLYERIDICKEKNPNDYATVTAWLNCVN